MTTALTRRTLLSLCGGVTLAGAMAGALRAEGLTSPVPAAPAGSPALPFALTTPLHVGEVCLKARDIGLLKGYYQKMLGFEILAESADEVTLGAGGTPLLHLVSRPEADFEAGGEAGLYHTAFLMPSRADLARWLVHVAMSDIPLVGFADHSVSEAVYLADPEGNGIEVYSDRSKEGWTWNEGRVTMGTKELDIEDILQKTGTPTDRNTYAGIPAALRIGHIHLRVGALEAARGFYQAGIGLDVVAGDDQRGATFLSSGRYHHHVGANVWESENAGLRKENATGLDWFSLSTRDETLIAARRSELAAKGFAVTEIEAGIEAKDPWGTRVRLVKA